jgi:uncharacterized protein (DUF983 family)
MGSYAWYDLVGNIGVALVLAAYLGLTLGRFAGDRPPYLLLNLVGSVLLLVSLVFAFNLSAVLIQVFWIVISLIGLGRFLYRRRRRSTRS